MHFYKQKALGKWAQRKIVSYSPSKNTVTASLQSDNNAKPIKKVPRLFLIHEECSFSYFPLTCFWRVAFISPRLKFNEEKSQRSVIRKTKIALHSQPGGVDSHLCFIIYGEAIHFFSFFLKDMSFTHVTGNYALPVVELPCFTAYQIVNSPIAEHPSQAHYAGAHFDDIIIAVTLIVDGPLWVKGCHGLLHTHICLSIAQHRSILY